MFEDLFEQMNTIELEIDQKHKLFIDRTNLHINYVKQAAAEIVNVYPEYVALLTQVELHDASKFEEPEKGPYIELTWQKKHGNTISDEVQQNIVQATLHHIKNNSHHPEYHLEDKERANLKSTNRDESIECIDATLMPDVDIVEMVADWQAMSVELCTNTSREWYNKVKNVRWHYSEHQDELIDKLLKVFEEKRDE